MTIEPAVAIRIPSGVDTPVPVIDIDILESNIARMANQMAIRGIALRPHFKTPKMMEVANRQLSAGAAGITCATIGEAEVLAEAGVKDIFVAYPFWASEPKASRLVQVLERTPTVAVGIDSVQAAEQLASSFADARRRPSIMIEVDCGDRRSGVSPDEAGLLARLATDRGLDVRGVFTHGGHGYEPGCRDSAADDEVRSLSQAAASFRRHGLIAHVVSAGSTPTVERSARDIVTEERPGTYVFGDRQQALLGSCNASEIALVVAATVVSTSVPGQFVIDAGAKSLGKDRPPWLAGHGHIPAQPTAVITRIYDHHSACELASGTKPPAAGDVISVIPNHVCPVLNLAKCAVVARNGEAIDRWNVVGRAL